jgi:hypothetical protein
MTPKQFRQLALALPEAVEQSHMGHPDFRVGGKIFASVGPDQTWAMIKLTADQQASFMAGNTNFSPAAGAWGRRGCTIIQLRQAKAASVEPALIAAWRNTAGRALVKQYDEQQ